MKQFLLIISTFFLIACSDRSDNQIYLRDKGYKDIWCAVDYHCISVDSVGNIYHSVHPQTVISEGEWSTIEKIYEPKCK